MNKYLTNLLIIFLLITSCNRANQYDGIWFIDIQKSKESCVSSLNSEQDIRDSKAQLGPIGNMALNSFTSFLCNGMTNILMSNQLVIENGIFKAPIRDIFQGEENSYCYIKRGKYVHCGISEESSRYAGEMSLQESLLILKLHSGESTNMFIYSKA